MLREFHITRRVVVIAVVVVVVFVVVAVDVVKFARVLVAVRLMALSMGLGHR